MREGVDLGYPISEMENLPAAAYTVLIVDDAPAVRQALRWALENELDMTVVGEAGEGQEALERAEALRPDVVILDIELPGLDGYAVTRALKARPDPPAVLYLTVHSDAASRTRGRVAGGDGFVEKGSGWPELLAQIRRVLADYKQPLPSLSGDPSIDIDTRSNDRKERKQE
jgi:DNA-binding NarL/FixJ family response regulator